MGRLWGDTGLVGECTGRKYTEYMKVYEVLMKCMKVDDDPTTPHCPGG